MDSRLETLTAYNVIDNQKRVSLLNAEPRAIPFQNLATPTLTLETQSAIITIGRRPFVLNQLQLTSITASGLGAIPQSFFMSFNVYDENNLGLFGAINPRASTVFGDPVTVPYAIQPVKVFAPRTRIKLEWTNHNPDPDQPLGFEMFLNGIDVLGYEANEEGKWNADEFREAFDELMERRVR